MTSTLKTLAILLLLSVPVNAAPPSAPVGVNRVHQQQRAEHYDRFFGLLDELLKYCESKGLTDAVAELRHWQTPVSGESLLGRPLPLTVQPDLPRDLSEVEREWQVPLRAARLALAKDLYLLSRRMLTANHPSAAWGLLREVVYFDPDHERARSLLGFERYGNEWTTPFSARKRKSGQVWHNRFGWLPVGSVARYEAGERYYRTQWMTAERETAIRKEWEVETDHYKVKTTAGLERGVEIAKALEDFHKYFCNTFAAFFDSPEQLKKNFEGTGAKAGRANAQFEVYFFRTKEEYITRLQKDEPLIAITNGIYMPNDRVAYFFDSATTDVEATLYHEATHQLLFELHKKPRQIAEHEHFWIVEGIACYMESFRRTEAGFVIGDPKCDRFAAAQFRALDDKPTYYIPLQHFTSMGKLAFQTDPRIEKNYSQASGLAHFFMHYGDGQYRDALVQHLERLYFPHTGRVRIAGLDQLTGVSYEDLDRQYIEHLKTFPR